jgi:hypothetical protein
MICRGLFGRVRIVTYKVAGFLPEPALNLWVLIAGVPTMTEIQAYESPIKDNPVARLTDEVVAGWMGSKGNESSMSRIQREGHMIEDGISQGLADCFRDLPNTGGQMAVKFGEAALIGAALSFVYPLGGARIGALCSLAALAGTLAGPGGGIEKGHQMWTGISDYWNNPQNTNADRESVRHASPVFLNAIGCIGGFRYGSGLGWSAINFWLG